MVDVNKKLEQQEEAPSQAPRQTPESSQQSEAVGGFREGAMGVIIEGQEGGSEMAERSEESMESYSEGSERKGDGVTAGKKDDGAAGTQQGDDGNAFVFDEHNLPPAPKMIAKIEKALRKEIHQLEKQARRYQGGLFRKPNYPKYSETMIEIRQRTVLLKRLLSMAADAVKKLFVQMFKPKNVS